MKKVLLIIGLLLIVVLVIVITILTRGQVREAGLMRIKHQK